MKSVGIKVLNSRLGEYMRLAASGETILVMDRDRVIAEICPPRVIGVTGNSPFGDGFLADAVRGGWLTPPALTASEQPKPPAPVARLSEILDELDEDRRER